MINNIYSSAVAITIGILILSIFTFKTYHSEPHLRISGGHKYIKTKDQVISVPHHILEALLVKYRDRLINKANSNIHIDCNLLDEVNESLAQHVYLKYGIKYDLYPIEMDKYLLNQGLTKTNIYDDELVGGVDFHSTTNSLGVIIWYLERILLENRNNKHTVEIPLILEKVDEILATMHLKDVSLYNLEIKTSLSKCSTPAVIDIIDSNEQWRLPTKSNPKECSKTLRNNLQNYISDSAAQDMESILSVGNDGNQKAKNHREALSSWQKNNIFRMAEVSHTRDGGFGDNDNREMHQKVSYAGYDLPLKLMKDERNNKLNNNQKQSLTDSWDYLENQFLTY